LVTVEPAIAFTLSDSELRRDHPFDERRFARRRLANRRLAIP
jgi:hypothetical protein